jgi:hypothetical protein
MSEILAAGAQRHHERLNAEGKKRRDPVETAPVAENSPGRQCTRRFEEWKSV